jgi:hypothetical protein
MPSPRFDGIGEQTQQGAEHLEASGFNFQCRAGRVNRFLGHSEYRLQRDGYW